MSVVYKYCLEGGIVDSQVMMLPRDAKILDLEEQEGRLYLWALTSFPQERIDRHLRIFGTGHELGGPKDDFEFIKTIHKHGLVWHVFLEKEG